MRKLLPLALLVITGCGYGPARMRAGSDMVLPEHHGLMDALFGSLACSAQKRDSLQKTPAATGSDAARATCDARKDPGKK